MSADPATQLTTLPNGLRVVSHTMPHLKTVSLGIWVGVGSRNEREARHGVCHLLEHMAFKGTKTRSARAIAEDIEMVGGDINAATSVDMTAYYVRVLETDVALAVDILSDILQHSRFDPYELALEKDVVLQEIAGLQDIPDELAYDLLQNTTFPSQSVGRPVIGTVASVTALQPDDLRDHLHTHYTANNMVLSAAGAIDHTELVRHAEARFSGLSTVKPETPPTAEFVGGSAAITREFEQSHVLLGLNSPAVPDEDFLTSQLFACLLGGGMSSRLFQTAREDKGLCYAIYASAWGLKDCGLFTVHAATSADLVTPLFDVVVKELDQCAAGEISDAELLRAKAQIKVGMLMALESSAARAEQMARQLLNYNRLLPTEEIITRVEAQTQEDMTRIAQKLRSDPRHTVVVVGAGEQSAALAQRALGVYSTD